MNKALYLREMKKSITMLIIFGAGIPILMFVLQMLGNAGEKAEVAKYFTCFSLFDANRSIMNEPDAGIKAIYLVIGAIVLFVIGSVVFCKKDMSL